MWVAFFLWHCFVLFKLLSLTFVSFFFSFIVVDRLQTHWEDSQTKLSDRMKQILNMLQDSTNWLDAKKEVDILTKQASERLESWQEITYTVDALKKQHADLRVSWIFVDLSNSWNSRMHSYLNYLYKSVFTFHVRGTNRWLKIGLFGKRLRSNISKWHNGLSHTESPSMSFK